MCPRDCNLPVYDVSLAVFRTLIFVSEDSTYSCPIKRLLASIMLVSGQEYHCEGVISINYPIEERMRRAGSSPAQFTVALSPAINKFLE